MTIICDLAVCSAPLLLQRLPLRSCSTLPPPIPSTFSPNQNHSRIQGAFVIVFPVHHAQTHPPLMGQFSSQPPPADPDNTSQTVSMAATDTPPDPFLDHVLSLLSAYDTGAVLPAAYPSFAHQNPKQAAVEQAINQLTSRLLASESELAERRANGSSSSSYSSAGAVPMTPAFTPPVRSTMKPPPPQHSYFCTTCGRAASSAPDVLMSRSGSSYLASPLVMPPGPIDAAAFESGLSAGEELHLLKAQVQDVARVCKVGIFLDLMWFQSAGWVGQGLRVCPHCARSGRHRFASTTC